MSIAVLTFQSRSRDTNDVFLAEGLADDIAARLGQVSRIVVRSREAVRRLPNAERMSMPELGQKLNAAYVLSGAVQPAGGRLRIIVELTRARSSDVAWTSPFDRPREDILTMQTEIASAVATAVAGRLGAVETRKVAASPTTNPQAFAHLIRGTAFMVRRMHQYSVPELRAAARLDPTSAVAWGRLGQALEICVSWSCRLDSASVLRREARAAADRAIALDSTSADAWLADGLAGGLAGGDMPSSRASMERAIRLDPRNAEAHHLVAIRMHAMGESAAAMREYQNALVIDPGRAITWAHLAELAEDEGRFADEEALADSALALQPDLVNAKFFKWSAVMFAGNASRMRGLSARLGIINPLIPIYEDAFVRLVEHDTAGASAATDRLLAANTLDPRVALLLVSTGRRAEAADFIRRLGEPGPGSWRTVRGPIYAPLRSIPEWTAYVERARERVFWTARPK
jgi:adenylate cyclase